MPLIVIAADERAVASEFNFDRDSDNWRARQESIEMAAQVSTNGHLVRVGDGVGHFILRDAPEYVVDAIRELVSEFRSGQ